MTFINMDIVVFKDSILMVSIVLKVQFLLQVHCRFWRELRSAKIVLAFRGTHLLTAWSWKRKRSSQNLHSPTTTTVEVRDRRPGTQQQGKVSLRVQLATG